MTSSRSSTCLALVPHPRIFEQHKLDSVRAAEKGGGEEEEEEEEKDEKEEA